MSPAAESNWGITQHSPGLFTRRVWEVIVGQHHAHSCLTAGPHCQPTARLLTGFWEHQDAYHVCVHGVDSSLPSSQVTCWLAASSVRWERGAPSEARAVPCSGAGSAGPKMQSTRMCIALPSLFTVPQTHYIPCRLRVWVSPKLLLSIRIQSSTTYVKMSLVKTVSRFF